MTTTKIVKSLSEKSEFDIQSGGGVSSSASWENIKESLGQAFNLRDNERILGIIADENGVTIRIGKK